MSAAITLVLFLSVEMGALQASAPRALPDFQMVYPSLSVSTLGIEAMGNDMIPGTSSALLDRADPGQLDTFHHLEQWSNQIFDGTEIRMINLSGSRTGHGHSVIYGELVWSVPL